MGGSAAVEPPRPGAPAAAAAYTDVSAARQADVLLRQADVVPTRGVEDGGLEDAGVVDALHNILRVGLAAGAALSSSAGAGEEVCVPCRAQTVGQMDATRHSVGACMAGYCVGCVRPNRPSNGAVAAAAGGSSSSGGVGGYGRAPAVPRRLWCPATKKAGQSPSGTPPSPFSSPSSTTVCDPLPWLPSAGAGGGSVGRSFCHGCGLPGQLVVCGMRMQLHPQGTYGPSKCPWRLAINLGFYVVSRTRVAAQPPPRRWAGGALVVNGDGQPPPYPFVERLQYLTGRGLSTRDVQPRPAQRVPPEELCSERNGALPDAVAQWFTQRPADGLPNVVYFAPALARMLLGWEEVE